MRTWSELAGSRNIAASCAMPVLPGEANRAASSSAAVTALSSATVTVPGCSSGISCTLAKCLQWRQHFDVQAALLTTIEAH